MPDRLNERQQSIIPIAAFTACGDLPRLEASLHQGLDSALSITESKEVLVQLYAYCGFPRSLNALTTLMSVVKTRRQAGTEDKVGQSASPAPANWNSLVNGSENQTRLVGKPVTGALFDFAPTIDQFLKSHLFGDIFQRDVLDWQTREVATISALAAISGVEDQLRSHYAISLNTGLTRAQLQHFTDILSSAYDPERAASARQILYTI
ncbi:Uncharacterized conserved protein YurZ, alkylhydroperoxidase/carboxymuconolactone decarboxylase family [Izhakiella capsodis]|uniref:Uncharacterized conserved protein YurZ, alkylhydroperoxidase/carboxymuconolactone decarboxylase family n=1 Tax=Izhakiella capsodis TaxID=1367852 RepID=A0A1I4VB62_9GAMM|nr:carboxymuconolactone decarboxylase family protein [Izhakiella capsodis]SFM98428.1 Uncharacterized conserved protein YurZ, alkylhydroperoxidase/carboxymuconolactone decarboxylase family [Izhakiella capsodis]